MRSIPWLIAAALLFLGAGLVAPPRVPLSALGRDLVRPAILPVLWAGLESARRDGTPEEYADRGRLLMKLIPHWTDGHIHIASQLARAQTDPGAALDRLTAGLELLDAAIRANPTEAARREILQSQARLLFVRCSQDPALAAAFLQRTRVAPAKAAAAYLRQIDAFRGSQDLTSDLFAIIVDGIPTGLELGSYRSPADVGADVTAAMSLLQHLYDRPLAEEWRISLQKLRSFLLRTDDITLSDLGDYDLLARIIPGLARAGW